MLSPASLDNTDLLHIVLELPDDLRSGSDDLKNAIIALGVVRGVALLELVAEALASVDLIPSTGKAFHFEVGLHGDGRAGL